MNQARELRPSSHLVVVGAGNIGSQLLPHLARAIGSGELVIVDQGRYEMGNVTSQAIDRSAAGRWKVQVQAQALRRINPALRCRGVAAAVETIPLGLLRADVIAGCTDSRATRQYLNQVARHLGVPFVDAGVFADRRLARVTTYLPRADAGCLECMWDAADYAAIEQVYPCRPGAGEPPATGASAALGALSAALQALAIERLLAGRAGDESTELVVDAESGRAMNTTIRRTARCRLGDHAPWTVRTLEASSLDASLERLLSTAARDGVGRVARVMAPGLHLVTGAFCVGCGARRHRPPRFEPASGRSRRCARCGGVMASGGGERRDALEAADALPGLARRTLAQLGLRPHDIIGVDDGDRTHHYLLPPLGRRVGDPAEPAAEFGGDPHGL